MIYAAGILLLLVWAVVLSLAAVMAHLHGQMDDIIFFEPSINQHINRAWDGVSLDEGCGRDDRACRRDMRNELERSPCDL